MFSIDNLIDITAISVQVCIAFLLVWYSLETRWSRQQFEGREGKELRGYFGYLKDTPIKITKDSLTLTFKNFGKTPIYISKIRHSFVDRNSGREFPQVHDHTKRDVLFPNGILKRVINPSVDLIQNLHQHNLRISCEYKTEYKDKENYVLILKFIGKPQAASCFVEEENFQ